MKISNAIFLVILYYLFLEIVGCWIIFIPLEMEMDFLIKAYHLINALVILIFLVLIFKSLKQPELLQFEKTAPKYYFIAIILGIGFVLFQPFLNLVYFQEISFNYGFTLRRLTSIIVFTSILIVPIIEELFFRNYILRGLLKNYKPALSIILSSFLFAAVHLPFVALFSDYMNFDVHQAYIALFGGLISGLIYYKSKSIIPSIVFHIFWNLASYIL